ncbi:hypothetical protein BOTNAR_0407g00040 [Botryotinia narcissicola]|uniref:Uncharacterized protein n=1 Tax=Botryotinia narcissicola TaxID=278944 RepID=A0A4Z1HMM9_9HELO|nr:hypothetical protein BOTNAR_0407g00040 [Botryotinia narcissicola]
MFPKSSQGGMESKKWIELVNACRTYAKEGANPDFLIPDKLKEGAFPAGSTILRTLLPHALNNTSLVW